MTAAHGGVSPDGSVPVTAVRVPLGRDVRVQAAAGEATVIGADGDRSQLGAGDAGSGLSSQRSGQAMTPAADTVFTREG